MSSADRERKKGSATVTVKTPQLSMQNITMRHVRESEVEEDSSLFYTDLRSRGARKSDKRVDSSSEDNTKRGMEIEHEG